MADDRPQSTPEPTPAQVRRAAALWVSRKDRETDVGDLLYFERNWRYLPGLRKAVEEECARG